MTKHLQAFANAQPDAPRGGLAALAHAVVTTPDSAITPQMRDEAAKTASKVGTMRRTRPVVLRYVVKSSHGVVLARCIGSSAAAAVICNCVKKGATVEFRGKVVYKSSGVGSFANHDVVWKMISDATERGAA
jgi:hypothetical protein